MYVIQGTLLNLEIIPVYWTSSLIQNIYEIIYEITVRFLLVMFVSKMTEQKLKEKTNHFQHLCKQVNA